MFGTKKLLRRHIDGNVESIDGAHLAPQGYRAVAGHNIDHGSAAMWWLICERCGATVIGLESGSTQWASEQDVDLLLSAVPLHDEWHEIASHQGS